MSHSTMQPYEAAPIDQTDALIRLSDEAVGLVEDLLANPPSPSPSLRSLLNSPRCAFPDPIAVIVSTGPVLCPGEVRRFR